MPSYSNYYSDRLSSDKLRRCYEIAQPRIQQYLKAEIEYILKKVKPSDVILELGCGYGRALEYFCDKARKAYGIDNSIDSLLMAKERLSKFPDCYLSVMDADVLGFQNDSFDMVICIQNGISAFKVGQMNLIKQSIRITRPGGIAFFSSYSDKIWSERLKWFELQAKESLLGEIDYGKTGDGVIVCKDGFKATTVSPDDFKLLTKAMGLKANIVEVDNSSVFCEIFKNPNYS